MKAFLYICSFFLLLPAMGLFTDADSLSGDSAGPVPSRKEVSSGDQALLKEGKTTHTQKALLLAKSSEHYLTEETRPSLKEEGVSLRWKSFPSLSVHHPFEKLLKEDCFSQVKLVPLYLRILFLRL